MDVIGLLQSKKRCLRRFLEVSESFLKEAREGSLSGLEHFESQRETVIKMLGMIDSKITDTVREIPLQERTPTLSHAVQSSLDEEAFLVQSILVADNKIMECIELEKQRLHKELTTSRKSHELAGRFKSTWVPEAGEELDQKA